MADNMIELVAKLDTNASEEQIKSDIKTISDSLNSKGIALDIKCNLDTESIAAIQTQLSEFTKDITVDIGISNFKKIDNIVDNKAIKNQSKALTDALNLDLPRGKTEEIRATIKGLIDDYKKAFQSNNYDAIVKAFDALDTYVRQFRSDIVDVNESLLEMQEHIKALSRGNKVLISDSEFEELKYILDGGKNARDTLTKAFGIGGWTKDALKGNTTWDAMVQEMNQVFDKSRLDSISDIDTGRFNDHIDGVIQLVDFLNKDFNEGSAIVKQYGEAIDKAFEEDLLTNLNRILGIEGQVSQGFVEILDPEEMNRPVQVAKEIIETYATAEKQTDSLRQQQEILWQSYEKTLARIQKAKLDINAVATRQEITTGEEVNYNTRFQEIMNGGVVDATSLAEAKRLLTAIDKEFQTLNAKVVADIPQNVIENLVVRIAKADSEIKLLTEDFKKLNSPPEELVNSMDKLWKLTSKFDFDTDLQGKTKDEIDAQAQAYTKIKVALNDAQSLLQVAQKKEAAFNKEFEKELKIEERINKEREKSFEKEFKEALKEEEKEIALKEKELELIRQIKDESVKDYKQSTQSYWNGEFDEKAQKDYWDARSAEAIKGLTAENDVLKQMKQYYEDIEKQEKEAAKAQKELFKEEKQASAHARRIKSLSADMDRFAAANKRAVESTKQMSSGRTFADEWTRLTTEMAKGAELTDEDLKNLTTDFRVFGKEAQAAGLKGASFFGQLVKGFGVINTYISATRLVSMAVREIRSAITEIQEVDDVLTEISKTSDRTYQSLKKLGNESFDTASKYGKTASDYLLGVQEMSRAGFVEEEAEGMAELSVLAQSAGDMTAELANQYLIATNAAYQYEGNLNKLNDALDRQNYITNHYAVSMSDLAEATKIASSQAAQSGIEIDEMTAALATMISTTQQGGEVAARSLRGILMNLRQVTGEVGDGEEDITAASLNKYEKAAAELGVSLKEVRDGAVALRDPMDVLNDLAEAFNAEADDSIKKANLINAIGGKYRGNQLSALLSNWETFQNILASFNSEQAAGSAMEEAQKSANNWSGSLNKVKNSWSELLNEFANSDNAIKVLQSVNSIIQNITESVKNGSLGDIADWLANAIKYLGVIVDKIGAIPTLLSGMAVYNAFKGQGIFGTIFDTENLGTKFKDVIGGTQSLTGAIRNLVISEKSAEIGTKALTFALNTLTEVGATIVISLIASKIADMVHAGEEAAEKLRQQEEAMQSNVQSYQDAEETIRGLYTQYVKLKSTTTDLTTEKKKLLDIQERLNEAIGEQTDKVDLLNGSLEENIKKTQEQRKEEYRKTIEETQAYYDAYQEGLEANRVALVTKGDKDLEEAYSKISEITGITVSGTLEEQSAQLEKMLAAYKQIEGYNQNDYNVLLAGKQVIDADIEKFQSTIDAFDKAVLGYDELSIPDEQLSQFNKLLAEAIKTQAQLEASPLSVDKFTYSQNLEDIRGKLSAVAGSNSELQRQIDETFEAFENDASSATKALGEWRTAWFETLDETHKAALKNVDTMKSALQTLSNDGGLSADDFWGLAELDTDGILNNIQMIGDKFVVSDEQVIQLKDRYIQKQLESIKLRQQELVSLQHQAEGEIIAYKNLIKEYDEARYGVANYNNPDYRRYVEEQQQVEEGLKRATERSKQYGKEWKYNALLIKQYNSSLGDTVDHLKQMTETLQEQADNYLKAFEGRVDDIIDTLEEEKEALEENRDVLQEQLNLLEEQKENLESIVDDYKTVADVVSDVIQKQIDALKEQNEEREEAIDLAEKLANLENAKNNKVRTYTEAGGWTYEAKKADVQKAEEDLRKSEIDEQIKRLEAYQKKWQNIPNKAEEKANESLADQILGAKWRDRIADQDEDIFEMYETEYDKYCDELYRVSNVDMETARKAVEAANKQVSAKDKEIKKWQEYKSKISSAADDAKRAVEGFYDTAYQISLSMGSDEGEMAQNLNDFYENYSTILKNLKTYQDELNESMGAFDASDMRDQIKDIAELDVDWDEVLKALKEYNLHINSNSDARLHEMDLYADGGVNTYTGVAMLHGTKQKAETVFNANDAAKLYDLVHNTPNLVATMITNGMSIAKNFRPSPSVDNSGNITFNGTTINLPNVQNPEQFARQMEMYMQTVLSESQVYKPRR